MLVSNTVKYIIKSILASIAVLVLIQVIPYGRTYTNPPVVREPSWNNSATRAIAKRACFDCHSNETIWPWYSRIAPVSWLVRYDVDEGRSELNFSEWQNGAREGERPDKISKEISKGKMPPFLYLPTHPEARLSDAEKRQLIDGLNATALRR
jgi:hypothetical protein